VRAEQIQRRHPEFPQGGFGFFQTGDDVIAAHAGNVAISGVFFQCLWVREDGLLRR
jgi:hypothetical protein